MLLRYRFHWEGRLGYKNPAQQAIKWSTLSAASNDVILSNTYRIVLPSWKYHSVILACSRTGRIILSKPCKPSFSKQANIASQTLVGWQVPSANISDMASRYEPISRFLCRDRPPSRTWASYSSLMPFTQAVHETLGYYRPANCVPLCMQMHLLAFLHLAQ
jgi:hypothetical protein